MKTPFKLGATGQFPRGKARPDDEGELRLALAADHRRGIVQIDFGKEVAWLGMESDKAREFARLIIEKADELDRGKP